MANYTPYITTITILLLIGFLAYKIMKKNGIKLKNPMNYIPQKQKNNENKTYNIECDICHKNINIYKDEFITTTKGNEYCTTCAKKQ